MIVEIIQDSPESLHTKFIKIDFDGRQQFYVSEGEPEDNTLNRNFSGCYMIQRMLEQVYIAGQKGEDIQFINKQV